MSCGVRQGAVLSPHFFAVCIDDIVCKVISAGAGCYIGLICFSILLYADDILLLVPSLSSLQKLLFICEYELGQIDLAVNTKKSVFFRIGPRCAATCTDIETLQSNSLLWVNSLRYLGVHIISGKTFRCNFDNAKEYFSRALIAIYGTIGRTASEEVVLSLGKSNFCHSLLYGIDVISLNKTELRSVDFPVINVLMKLFRASSTFNIHGYQFYLNFPSVETYVMLLRNNTSIVDVLRETFAQLRCISVVVLWQTEKPSKLLRPRVWHIAYFFSRHK